jgi:hypothetical protein
MDHVKINSQQATLISGNKIKVEIDLCEGHTNPTINLSVIGKDGIEISHSVILGAHDTHIVFTLHLRKQNPEFPLTVLCESIVEEDVLIDTKYCMIAKSE